MSSPPRAVPNGAQHALLGLVLKPLAWGLVTFPLAVLCAVLAGNQEDHKGYFAASAVFAMFASVSWLIEAFALMPVACRWRQHPVLYSVRHNPLLSVTCYRNRTCIMLPSVVRSVVVAIVQLASPVFALVGLSRLSLAEESQLTVEGVLGLSICVYIATATYGAFPYLRRFAKALCCSDKTGKGVLRVLQFNVNACVGPTGRFDVGRVADAIRHSGADVVALQELARNCTIDIRGNAVPAGRAAVDQIRKLAELTGFHATFCNKTRGLGGDFGNALLSRYPVLETARRRLVSWKHHGSNISGGPMPQIALAIRVRPEAFTRDVWVVSTQFGNDFSGQEQLEEMLEIIEFSRTELRTPLAAETSAAPSSAAASSSGSSPPSSALRPLLGVLPTNVVVCGDLASPSAAPCFSLARDCGLCSAESLIKPRVTPCGTTPSPAGKAFFSPDKILINRAGSLKVLDCRPLRSIASTHRPVLAVIADGPPDLPAC